MEVTNIINKNNCIGANATIYAARTANDCQNPCTPAKEQNNTVPHVGEKQISADINVANAFFIF